jgi:CheY-like chemotaxis protein
MARILIAEDDESVGALVARALSQEGNELALAADGAEALDRLSQG